MPFTFGAVADGAAVHAGAGSVSWDSLLSLLTLTGMEIVLGIDNIVVIALITGRLPNERRKYARTLGLGLAMFMRIALLLGITWVMSLTKALFTVAGHGYTGKDLILLGGGVFLIYKGIAEIREKFAEHDEACAVQTKPGASFKKVIVMILGIDFDLPPDSVITAVGMSNHRPVMIAAVVASVLLMMVFSGAISHFIEDNPTIKMLALAFLMLIGVVLMSDGLGVHIDKKYVYVAMGFSLAVELLNLKILSREKRRVYEAGRNA